MSAVIVGISGLCDHNIFYVSRSVRALGFKVKQSRTLGSEPLKALTILSKEYELVFVVGGPTSEDTLGIMPSISGQYSRYGPLYESESRDICEVQNIHFLIGTISIIMQKFSKLVENLDLIDGLKFTFVMDWLEYKRTNVRIFDTILNNTDILAVYGVDNSQGDTSCYVKFLSRSKSSIDNFKERLKILSKSNNNEMRLTSNGSCNDKSLFLSNEMEDVPIALDFNRKIHDENLKNKINKSLSYIRNSIENFGLESIAIGFNGGKDSTVVLNLVYFAREEYINNNNVSSAGRLKALLTNEPLEFSELAKFTSYCEDRYDIDIRKFDGTQKENLSKFLSENPEVKSIILGNRRTDSFSFGLLHIQNTDDSWPRILRIHPILDWTYQEIWTFIISLNIPYCVLYDYGYTSLGNLLNTIPNPFLQDPLAPCGYKRALELQHCHQERLGRISMGELFSKGIIF